MSGLYVETNSQLIIEDRSGILCVSQIGLRHNADVDGRAHIHIPITDNIPRISKR